MRALLSALFVALVSLTACSSTGESTASAVAAPAEPIVEQTAASDEVDPSTEQADDAADFAALNQAEGYGFLRVMDLEERPDSLDVVIYEALPNELPRVAGVITGVAQAPLAHVNLRAVQDNVPNAFIEDPLDIAEIDENIGRYVYYVVTEDGWTIEPATQAEVAEYHADRRPDAAHVPERDLSVTEIQPLDEVAFDDWDAVGVKAANLATLGRVELTNAWVPDGFAVPFSFYDDFMESNGFYDEVAAIIADAELAADQDALADRLKQLRKDIKDAPLSPEVMDELAAVQDQFAEDQPIRCRSSTNNEDLPNFSGAGLYDSFTQHPDEGHMEKCIKQVFASTWNFRAYLEREFYRIDHTATAMGVLLHNNFEGEEANGVAVSIDPIYDTTDAYYVNTQLGEDLVTNPEALSIPEALFLELTGGVAVLTYSNQAEPGELLMTDDQMKSLRLSLAAIHDSFAELYGVDGSEPFAMEIEFKITDESELAIKQARPWVFN